MGRMIPFPGKKCGENIIRSVNMLNKQENYCQNLVIVPKLEVFENFIPENPLFTTVIYRSIFSTAFFQTVMESRAYCRQHHTKLAAHPLTYSPIFHKQPLPGASPSTSFRYNLTVHLTASFVWCCLHRRRFRTICCIDNEIPYSPGSFVCDRVLLAACRPIVHGRHFPFGVLFLTKSLAMVYNT